MKQREKYIALLRGINVGGHHKLPMKDLEARLSEWGLSSIITILNTGNLIFEYNKTEEPALEKNLSSFIEREFGFPVPVLIRRPEELLNLRKTEPFSGIKVTDDIRLYVSFLREWPEVRLTTPKVTNDGSFSIIMVTGRAVCSVLDLSVSGTSKAMDLLEKQFGRDLTTRNWNTLLKIAEHL